MAVSGRKPGRLPEMAIAVQIDTTHRRPEIRVSHGVERFDHSVNRTAVSMLLCLKARRGLLFWLVGVALSLKVVLLFVLSPMIGSSYPDAYRADLFPDGYDMIALNVAEGYGYRWFPDTSETMIRTPGFVLVLAGVFWLFGKSLWAVKVLNLLISVGTAYLVYRLGVRVTKSSLCGTVAACICFFYPGMVIAESRGGVETLYAFCIVLFMLMLYQALERETFRSWGAAGAAFGLLLLVRSTAGLFPVLLTVWLLVHCRTSSEASKTLHYMIVLGLAAALVMSPWILRNFQLTGKFIPTMTVAGMSMFEGSYLARHYSFGRDLSEVMEEAAGKEREVGVALQMPYKGNYELQFFSPLNEVRYYKELGHLGLQEYKNSPGLLARAVGQNAVAFWIRGRTRSATLLNAFLVVPAIVVATWGWFMARARGMEIVPIALFVASCFIAHLPLTSMARHHVPMIPLMAIFIAIPIAQVLGVGRVGGRCWR
jgi:4-amino-4-deoxy-L-arabinose transferase-like glycosyltransferase